MPFPLKNAANAQEFAAQVANGYEVAEGEQTEFDSFIESITNYLEIMESEGRENTEEAAAIRSMLEMANELSIYAKDAVAYSVDNDNETARRRMLDANRAAQNLTAQMDLINRTYGFNGEHQLITDFADIWADNAGEPRPYKKYANLAGTFRAPRMPSNMSEKGKWRRVIEQNTGSDLPGYTHEAKVDHLALALAAYMFQSTNPIKPYNESELKKAADALKKDAVFKFYTDGAEEAVNDYVRNADFSDLISNIGNRFVDVEDNYYTTRELDRLGEIMRLYPAGESRSQEWKDFHSKIVDYTSPANRNMSVERRMQGILETVEKYIKGKKSLRSSEEGQASFDLAMCALSIVADSSPTAKARVDAIVNEINHVRTHRPFGRKQQTVDLTQYGLAKAEEAAERARRANLKNVPRNVNAVGLDQLRRNLRTNLNKYSKDYIGYDPGEKDQVTEVTQMIADAVALMKATKYRRSSNTELGKFVDTVLNQSEYDHIRGDLSRDPAIRAMALRYMNEPEYRASLCGNAFGMGLNEYQIANKMNEEYENRRLLYAAPDAGPTDVMAIYVRYADRELLPARPADLQDPLDVFQIRADIHEILSENRVAYLDNQQFKDKLVTQIANAIALTKIPAYRSGGKAVVDGVKFAAEVQTLQNDPSVLAIAQRMIDDPEYRNKMLFDYDLAKQMGIPEGMPLPNLTVSKFANALTLEKVRMEENLKNLEHVNDIENANIVNITRTQKTLQKFYDMMSGGLNIVANKPEDYDPKVHKNMYTGAEILKNIATALAIEKNSISERIHDGKLIEVADKRQFNKDVRRFSNDLAVKNILNKIISKEGYGSGLVKDDNPGKRVLNSKEMLAVIKEQYEIEKQEVAKQLDEKIEIRRAQREAAWQEARDKWKQADEAAKKIEKVELRFNDKGIPLTPAELEALKAKELEEQKQAEALKQAMEKQNAGGAGGKAVDQTKLVPLCSIKSPRDTGKVEAPPEEIKNPIKFISVRVAAGVVPQKYGKTWFDSEDLQSLAEVEDSVVTALAMNLVPAYKGVVDGEETVIADKDVLDAQKEQLKNDPAVKTIIENLGEDDKYFKNMTSIQEARWTPPEYFNGTKFGQTLFEEYSRLKSLEEPVKQENVPENKKEEIKAPEAGAQMI